MHLSIGLVLKGGFFGNVAEEGPTADPANPAIASPFHAGRHWRGVADTERYASQPS